MNEQNALSWYYWRFRSMGLAEIPHRVSESLLHRLCKTEWMVRRDTGLSEDILQRTLPVLPLGLAELPDYVDGEFRKDLAEDAASLCDQNIRLLNQSWPKGRSMEWSLDPESGEHWDWRRYARDIPHRNGQGPGDAKFVWELSRLQHLQLLALASHSLGLEAARRSCVFQLEHWLDNNPPFKGLGYASGIELASRVISILVVITYLGPSSFSAALRDKVWTALAAHGRYIARFPSLYSSANNHLVAESAALFVLGSVAPGLPGSGEWRKSGWARLVTESERQILADGAGAEQSTSYLGSTLEWFLLSRMVKVFGGGDETALDQALIRGASFISSVADRSGNVPSIGDGDDGAILRPRLKDSRYLSSIVASIATCLDRPDIQHREFHADCRTYMLSTKNATQGVHDSTSQTFPDGGYTRIRNCSGSRVAELLFDHGPLGFAATAAHGHADALSVWLSLDGQPVLVDFGTYRYAADGEFRSWARSTAAHNTIQINGFSQSVVSGPFNWRERAITKLVTDLNTGNTATIVAAHSGYQKQFGIIHQRSVAQNDLCGFEIRDALSGEGIHAVCLSYHFAADLVVEPNSNAGEFLVRRQSELVAKISIVANGMIATAVRQEGALQPGPGVVSPAYNKLVPSFSILATGRVKFPVEIKTIIDCTAE